MKVNHTKFAILGLLTTGCNTGYSIKQMIDRSLNHFWKISYGQIYPTLKNLVDEGLAIVQETTQQGKSDKKEYHITRKGQQTLQDWLQKPIEEIPIEKNEFILKLFFSRHEEEQTAIRHMENYLEKLQFRFDTYTSIETMITTALAGEEDANYWLFTLDYGKRTTKAAIDWCEDTIRKLKEMESGK
ncbi:PadR family transcriptional regulator [Radiobacillus kanasensis]|uniref:PadR family transcriptional regulator n=1 Tax=Radiobacillus kanasensis TaxID=2844358 RepID=UPI001E28AD74|nr:PadR family transcriptional regulator [Radiobacillus kanasensis]UFU00658.1 PadR family transcriptional regulator [Radiobacillus kanasensis]